MTTIKELLADLRGPDLLGANHRLKVAATLERLAEENARLQAVCTQGGQRLYWCAAHFQSEAMATLEDTRMGADQWDQWYRDQSRLCYESAKAMVSCVKAAEKSWAS